MCRRHNGRSRPIFPVCWLLSWIYNIYIDLQIYKMYLCLTRPILSSADLLFCLGWSVYFVLRYIRGEPRTTQIIKSCPKKVDCMFLRQSTACPHFSLKTQYMLLKSKIWGGGGVRSCIVRTRKLWNRKTTLISNS